MSTDLAADAHQLGNVQIVAAFKEFYRALDITRLDDIGSLYADNIVFRDPVHQLDGIHALHSYMNEMCGNVRQCRFEYLDELIARNSAYIKWHMYFVHPKLGGQTISVRGITHIEFDQKIHFHEDAYDLGQMLYEHLPLLGTFTRLLKRRLANPRGH